MIHVMKYKPMIQNLVLVSFFDLAKKIVYASL